MLQFLSLLLALLMVGIFTYLSSFVGEKFSAYLVLRRSGVKVKLPTFVFIGVLYIAFVMFYMSYAVFLLLEDIFRVLL